MKEKQTGRFSVSLVVAAVCLVYALGGGIRSNYGLMRSAIAGASGVDYAGISFVLAAAMSYTREQEQTALNNGHAIDYAAAMAPDLASFCQAAELPAAPNALSDAGYMFTLSGADLIRAVYAYCTDLGERMGNATEVKPGYAIKLALRLFLLGETSATSTAANKTSA